MPVVLIVLLSQSLGRVLLFEGYDDTPGSMHTAPGMACLFASSRWRSSALPSSASTAGARGHACAPRGSAPARCSPASSWCRRLLVLQHAVLFGFGIVALGFKVNGAWAAVALLALAFAPMILCAGLAAAALLSTVQQLNTVTNLGTMALGGLGGALVPVMELPKWVQPISPASPVNWAMEGYRDVILDGAGVGDIVLRLAAMCGLAMVCAAVAVLAHAPRRTQAHVGLRRRRASSAARRPRRPRPRSSSCSARCSPSSSPPACCCELTQRAVILTGKRVRRIDLDR